MEAPAVCGRRLAHPPRVHPNPATEADVTQLLLLLTGTALVIAYAAVWVQNWRRSR